MSKPMTQLEFLIAKVNELKQLTADLAKHDQQNAEIFRVVAIIIEAALKTKDKTSLMAKIRIIKLVTSIIKTIHTLIDSGYLLYDYSLLDTHELTALDLCKYCLREMVDNVNNYPI